MAQLNQESATTSINDLAPELGDRFEGRQRFESARNRVRKLESPETWLDDMLTDLTAAHGKEAALHAFESWGGYQGVVNAWRANPE